MRNLLRVLTLAGAVMVAGGTAQAQGVNLRIGIGDDGPGRYERRIDRDDVRVVREVRERPSFRHRIVERRIVRTVPRTRTVCRTVIRTRVIRAGVVVRRPTQVCTTRTRF